MFHLNEKHLGDRVTRAEINAAISTLQGKGYDVTYGPHCPDATAGIDKRHWRAAVKAAHKAAADAPSLRNLDDLPYAERITILQEICEYLTDKYLCPALFGDEVAQ